MTVSLDDPNLPERNVGGFRGALERIANPSTVAGMHYQDRDTKLQLIAQAALSYGTNLPDAGEIETILSLIPDRIEAVEGKSFSQQVVDAAWPIAGGNHQDAEFWWAVSFAAIVAERILSGEGRTQ